MDTLYAASGSTSLVAAILLEECEHSYTLELMALYPEGAGGTDYAKLNPWRQVPGLLTKQGLITEVIAIAHYLDRMHPERELLPLDAWQRTQSFRWYSCLATGLAPYVRCLVRPERFVGNEPALSRILGRHVVELLLQKLALIDNELAQKRWFVGDTFGPVDALLAVLFGWVTQLHMPVDSLVHLKEHHEHCLTRAAYVRAVDRHGAVPNIVRGMVAKPGALTDGPEPSIQ